MMLIQSNDHLQVLRRAAAELLAFVVKDLFPNVLLVEGNRTDMGFFYDFIFDQPLHDQALTLIEVRMRALIKEGIEIRSLSMMRENAHSFFLHHGHPLLAERASREEQNIISLIQFPNFFDVCPPLSLTSTEEIGSIRLLEFKRLDRLIPQEEEDIYTSVTRISGTAFEDPISLKKFIKALDQLKKRDHRLLGPELDLFSFNEQAGEIECFWHPKGETLRRLLLKKWEEECQKQQVQFVKTPLVVNEFFLKEKNLLPPLEVKENFYLLSASHFFQHVQLFKRRAVSVGDLPLRFAECIQEYQQEEESQLWGLLRAYSFSSDQMTIFCSEDQAINELISSLHFFKKIVRIFGFKDQWHLVTLGSKSSKGKQEKAVEWLTEALNDCEISWIETQDLIGLREPGIELRLVDCLGRSWKGPSIEVVVHFIERLDLSYQDANGQRKTPIVLKKSLFSSIDRFIALLIEQFGGVFPDWLAPEQIRVIAIGNQNRAYAEEVYKSCLQQGFRAQLDVRLDKLGMKIHEADKEKIPYLLIVGDKEENKKLVTVRAFQQKGVNHTISLEVFFDSLFKECCFPN
jgi:threonyl-tRNA synthetase